MMVLAVLKQLQDHQLVPRHEIVTKEKAEELFQQFGSHPEKLPHITKEDPIVEELSAKKGDLIRITRNSPTAGTTIYYRVVE